MKLHSNTFWEKSPLLMRQKPHRMDNLEPGWNDFLYEKMGPPFFHFTLLYELIRESKKRLGRFRPPIAMVDIYIDAKTLEKAVSIFEGVKNLDVLLDRLGLWLTEQVAAYTIDEKVIHLPTIYVRCFKTEALSGGRNFDFRFAPEKFSCKFTISIKAPSRLPKFTEDTEKLSLKFGLKTFEEMDIQGVNNLCPLVAGYHVELALSVDPSDQSIAAWVKHLGVHETWLVKDNEEWQLAPADAWTLLESGTYIVLGRVALARVEETVSGEKIVLAGSMVLTLEY